MADFTAIERRFGLPEGVLDAMMQTESGGRLDAVSPKGAQGPFQIMPVNSQGIDPRDRNQSAQRAAELVSRDLRRFGALPEALAAYNAGPTAVSRHGGIPPYRETQDYIDRVQARMPFKRYPAPGPAPQQDFGSHEPAAEHVNTQLMRQFQRIRQNKQQESVMDMLKRIGAP